MASSLGVMFIYGAEAELWKKHCETPSELVQKTRLLIWYEKKASVLSCRKAHDATAYVMDGKGVQGTLSFPSILLSSWLNHHQIHVYASMLFPAKQAIRQNFSVFIVDNLFQTSFNAINRFYTLYDFIVCFSLTSEVLLGPSGFDFTCGG